MQNANAITSADTNALRIDIQIQIHLAAAKDTFRSAANNALRV